MFLGDGLILEKKRKRGEGRKYISNRQALIKVARIRGGVSHEAIKNRNTYILDKVFVPELGLFRVFVSLPFVEGENYVLSTPMKISAQNQPKRFPLHFFLFTKKKEKKGIKKNIKKHAAVGIGIYKDKNKTHLGSECLIQERFGLVSQAQAKYPFPTL